MKIAVVHEWLVDWAGSEQVLEQILMCYPDADVFALADFLPLHLRDRIQNKAVTTSFLQHAPFARRALWKYLPLMPLAIRGLDVSRYDLVISSSHCVAKGVVTRPDQLHLSYVHSPMRYAWDLQDQYLQSRELNGPVRRYLARQIFRKLRSWDVRTARAPVAIAANSNYVAERIRRVWNRESRVIFPPVNTERFVPAPGREDFFLCASRLQFYKRVDVVVEAFASLPAQRLIVIGEGPERQRLESIAPKNVTFLGYQDDPSLVSHLQRARALIFAAEEDFGILPVEAQACGTPVIALGKGGALETVRGTEQPGATGVFFQRQDPDDVRDAVRLFLADEARYTRESCRANAMQFSAERFRNAFREFVGKHCDKAGQ